LARLLRSGYGRFLALFPRTKLIRKDSNGSKPVALILGV